MRLLNIATFISVLSFSVLAVAEEHWHEVYNGFGSGDSRDNACAAANANAELNAAIACVARMGTRSDDEDTGCSASCEKVGDDGDEVCTATDHVRIECEKAARR
jgi:hypothetical protein